MVRDSSYRAYILRQLDSNKYKGVLEWWDIYNNKKTKDQDYISQSFLRRTGVIFSDTVLKTTLGQVPKQKLDYRHWIDNGYIVLIRASEGLGNIAVKSIMALHMINFYQAALSREDISRLSRRPFSIVVDEPQTWLSNNEQILDDIFSKCRKYGVSIIASFQSSNQISKLSKNLINIILDNQPDMIQFKSDSLFLKLKDIEVSNIPKYHFIARISDCEPVQCKGLKPIKYVRYQQEVDDFVKQQHRKWNKHYQQVLNEIDRRVKFWGERASTKGRMSESHKIGMTSTSSIESNQETSKSYDSSTRIEL